MAMSTSSLLMGMTVDRSYQAVKTSQDTPGRMSLRVVIQSCSSGSNLLVAHDHEPLDPARLCDNRGAVGRPGISHDFGKMDDAGILPEMASSISPVIFFLLWDYF